MTDNMETCFGVVPVDLLVSPHCCWLGRRVDPDIVVVIVLIVNGPVSGGGGSGGGNGIRV